MSERFFSPDDTLFDMAGESGLRQRGRRFAPVFNVRAKARTCLRTAPSFSRQMPSRSSFLVQNRKARRMPGFSVLPLVYQVEMELP
jgi:hypothetical protein